MQIRPSFSHEWASLVLDTVVALRRPRPQGQPNCADLCYSNVNLVAEVDFSGQDAWGECIILLLNGMKGDMAV